MQINFKLSNSGNYQKGRSQAIQYIVIHYTSNKGDTAKNNADYFAREVTKTSAHYFVDENSVWQSVLDTDTAWHCGAKTYKHKYKMMIVMLLVYQQFHFGLVHLLVVLL